MISSSTGTGILGSNSNDRICLIFFCCLNGTRIFLKDIWSAGKEVIQTAPLISTSSVIDSSAAGRPFSFSVCSQVFLVLSFVYPPSETSISYYTGSTFFLAILFLILRVFQFSTISTLTGRKILGVI